MKGDGFELKEGRFRLVIRKKFFTLRVVTPGPGCPERWLMPHLWEPSRPGWTGSEQPDPDEDAHGRVAGPDDL